MSRSWDDLRDSIEEFFSTAAEKTDELIKVGRRKLSIAEIKRNMTANYAELGGRVYHLVRQGDAASVPSDSEVESLVSRIQRLEDELKAKEMEIEQIKTGADRPASGAPTGEGTSSADGGSNKEGEDSGSSGDS
jgi:gas vesicle protein